MISEQVHLPYGTALTAESVSYGTSANPSKKRFTSYERSDATKLDHAVNRHYHAGLGRFTQVDPLGMSAASLSDPQSLNLYAYCGNDPINHLDPDGLFFGKLFKWIGKAFRFLYKVATAALVALAILVLPHVGAFLLLMGLAGLTGIAGWHNGKLGNFVRTVLSYGGGNSKYGGFRTPSTFPSGTGVSGVSSFLQQGEKPSKNKYLDWLQTGLDLAGLIPAVGEIADGCNALISLGRGDKTGALLSAASMIPFAGWGAAGAKLGRRASRFISNVTVVSKGKVVGVGTVDIGPTLDRIANGVRYPHRHDGSIFENRRNQLGATLLGRLEFEPVFSAI